VIRLLQTLASAALTFWQSTNQFPTTMWGMRGTNIKHKGPDPRKLSQRRTTIVTIQG